MDKISLKQKKLIEANALAFATVDGKNNPHCISVGFAKVVSPREILITNNCMVETIKNIKRNPKMALAVWSKNWKSNCEGYEIRGRAKYFTSGKWYKKVKSLPENKGFSCRGAILVKVEKIKKLA